MIDLKAVSLLVLLTVNRQLHHQLIIVVLGPVDLVLHGLLILVSKHLRTLRAELELLEVGLQAFDNLTVFVRTHLGQLDTQHQSFYTSKSRGPISDNALVLERLWSVYMKLT